MTIRSSVLILLAGITLLAGCHKTPEAPPENQTTEPAAPPPPLPVAPAPEPVVAPPKPVVAKPKPAPEPTADQQMSDDADAVGMTSRTSSAANDANAAGNSQ
ncbi:hypothetical protein [Sphingomonas abietis]|uniref:Lipoprotein n=1 Tax=Sphingomonas abietis TaxID=3012344 RepID=A0ABY7NR24_9SPHN|nr:hypothetical protein [Sphingomonas abietis]WBO23997.1 hypothetical protein PBT88_07770 [Sphingomonas abietis]